MPWKRVKQWFLGKPLTVGQGKHERLSNPRALAIFSSDALSSVAYATEAILWVLMAAGSLAPRASLPVAIAITILLAIIISSYRQTVIAYPRGGGSYIVAKDNLGLYPGLVAAAALLIDYILTVAVSVSAAMSAFSSAFPEILNNENRRWAGIIIIALLGFVNLRGVKDIGRVFVIPTYVFIVSTLAMIGIGFARWFFDPNFVSARQSVVEDNMGVLNGLGLFLILRAFASGCTALTGIEAISDGVAVFREPTGKNARKTLLWMGVILGSMFMGISLLAAFLGIKPNGQETVVSQIAKAVFGSTNVSGFYYVIQAATMLILVLASNTAFSDFPRLSRFLALDEFLPKQFASVGYKLVYSFGIVVLSAASGVLVWLFNAKEHALLPFYAIGVFTAFTFSQAGMAVYFWKRRQETVGNYFRAFLSSFGALVTGVVFVLELVTKAAHGSYLVILVVIGLIILFRKIKAHYKQNALDLAVGDYVPKFFSKKHTVVLPIESVNRAALKALAHVIERKPSRIIAVHVSIDAAKAARFRDKWETHVARLAPEWKCCYDGEIELQIIQCDYEQEDYIVEKILELVRGIEKRYDDDTVTVVMPHLIFFKMLGRFLHNHSARAIEQALEEAPDLEVDVEFVPYRIK